MQFKHLSGKASRRPLIGDWWAWLPSRGNVLFTLLVVATLFWATNAGALPLRTPMAAGTSKTTINYQGYLTDSSGNPVDVPLDMVFRLYRSETDQVADAIWTETHTGVGVSDGLFSVPLGGSPSAPNPIPQSLLAENDSLWLGISVGGDQEMSPREKIASSPYAMLANVPDGSITQAKLANNAVISAKIQDGQVTSSDVGFNYAGSSSKGGPASNVTCTNCISSGEIQDGQVTSADIASNTITETDIADSFKARDADKLDGKDSGYFAAAGHAHDSRYYTKSTSDSRFVNAGGDGMSGDLDMNGRKLLDVNSIQIGGQGSISDKSDSGNGGPHMVFETDDTFTFQTGAGRLRLSPSSGIELAASGDLILNTPGHIVVRQSAYTIRPDAQGGVDIGHPSFKFRAIWGQENHIGATIETGLETPEEQESGISGIEEGDILVWSEGHLDKCKQPEDSRVQAVASTDGHPIVLGAELVKVLGPVKEGDLLVCSDVPGYALVSDDPAPGTVIAQALENFEGERGLIKAMIRKF